MKISLKKLGFVKSVKFKLLLIVIFSTLIGSPIAGLINSQLINLGFDDGGIFATVSFLVQLLTIPVLVVGFTHFFITKRVDKINRVLSQIDQGNYDTNYRDKWNDEISQLSENISVLSINLKESLRTSQLQSHKVLEHSKSFKTSLETLHQKNGTQTGLLESFNQSNQHVTVVFDKTTSILQEIANTIDHNTITMEKINDRTSRSSYHASESQKALKVISDQMETIQEESKETATLIRGLNSRMVEIEDVVEIIKGIADQTNLLALNASIEAARAGEHGKGFSIVANEVRKLAEHSIEATESISQVINTVNQDVKYVVSSMSENRNEINEGGKLFFSVYEKLDQVLEELQGYSSDIDTVSTTMEELNARTQEIASMMTDTKGSMEENEDQFHAFQSLQSEMLESINDNYKRADELVSEVDKLEKEAG